MQDRKQIITMTFIYKKKIIYQITLDKLLKFNNLSYCTILITSFPFCFFCEFIFIPFFRISKCKKMSFKYIDKSYL